MNRSVIWVKCLFKSYAKADAMQAPEDQVRATGHAA